MICPAVPGHRVIVPFGRQKQAVGIVAELAETSTFSPEKLKPVIACPDDDTLFPRIQAAAELGGAVLSLSVREVLFHAMPILLRQGKEAAFAPLWCWK